MNNDVIESSIQIMYHSVMDGDNFGIEKAMESVDMDEIADWFVQDSDPQRIDHLDLLNKFIQINRYIEFETPISSTLSDDKYDQLVGLYHNVTGGNVPRPDWSVDSSGVSEHSYPELRGTLDKVHFVLEKDIPEHDSRKSLESWIAKVMTNKLPKSFDLIADAKFDGHSVVFEMNKGTIVKALTRYRTDLNLGKDITHIFQGWNVSNLRIPEEFAKLDFYGVKTEIFMKYQDLKRYQEDTGNSNFNHRSAVASILTRSKGNEQLLKYLSVASFQVSTPIEVNENALRDGYLWIPAGIINNRFQYIRAQGFTTVAFSDNTAASIAERIATNFDDVRSLRDTSDIPLDGSVITIATKELIDKLGRKNDINQFQIAYKFPTGVAKTKLKRVTFPVGPCAGTITPLAELEPVIIDGKEIKSASLSNMEKLERLDLRVGDEVIIRYDIIPKLYKDETCKKGKGPKVVIPNACPSCGGELSENYRCTNPECPSKIPGKIYNYVTKMRIPNIGKQTIERLVSAGIWDGIHSLYRLPNQKDDILKVPGFGNTLVANMIAGVYSRTEVYPHEIFGAIGIPDMASKTMKKVFQSVDMIDLTRPSKTRAEQMKSLMDIKGIGEKKAGKLIDGLEANKDLITFLESHLTILPYEDTSEETPTEQNVVFTQVRDKPLEEYLKTKGIGTSNTVSAKTVAVITQNELYQHMVNKAVGDAIKKTTKIKDAEKRGIPIISIDDYKKKVGYEE